MNFSFEMDPPWVEYPDNPPWWGGWRQGNAEFWLHSLWLPFWQKLNIVERMSYIKRWQPPDEWQEYLMGDWW